MIAETRTKNSFRNIIFSIFAYLVKVILGFIIRRLFIYYFNEEYLGLNSLFSNVLSLLSLAELGFGTALVFSMYKPMAEGDTEKIKELLMLYKKYYTVIGFIVLLCGLFVLPFMDYFKAKAPQVDVNLYVIYLIYLFSTVVSYFFSYRRSLIYVSQRNDIESKVNLILNVISSILQVICLIFLKNFYLYISINLFSSIFNNILIYIITNKKYSIYIGKPNSEIDKQTKLTIKKNVYAMFFHKLGGVIVFGTDNLLIYFMLGASVLGKYSNYTLIISSVTSFLTLFINSIKASIGNSLFSEDKEKNYQLFRKLNFVYLFIVGFCAICIFVLSNPFINIVLDKSHSGELIFDVKVVALISLSFFITNSRNMVVAFKDSIGLFYEDRLKPVFESILNLTTSVILAKFIGISGIIIGTIFSNIFVALWVEPYVLNKHFFYQSTIKYFVVYYLKLICIAIVAFCVFLICNCIIVNSFASLIFCFAIAIISCFIILLITMSFFPDFKQSLVWSKNILLKLIKNKV